MNEKQAQTWLQQQVRHSPRLLGAMLTCKAVQLGAQLCSFWFMANILSHLLLTTSKADSALWYYFASAVLVGIGARHCAVQLEQYYQRCVQHQLEQALHQQWQAKQQALLNNHSNYFWQQVLLEHIPAISQYASQYQVQLWLSALVPFIVVTMLFPVNWFIALILLLTLPTVPLFMILIGKKATELHSRHFEVMERMGGMFGDRLKALTLLTTFNRHQSEQAKLANASAAVNQRTLEIASVAFLNNTVLDFFSTLAMALVAVYVGFSLLMEINIGPQISYQSGLFVLLSTPMLMAELKTLGRLYHQKAKANAAAKLLQPILQTENIERGKHDFTGINWLSFHQPIPNLSAKRLCLNPGDKVLLTGASGAGKSKFLEALAGLREASHQLDSHCTILTQTPTILPEDLRRNLTLGNNITTERLLEVIEQVQLRAWFDKLPDGLDTIMGEHPPLSGGEAQRLALARVMLHNSGIIMLDEPTAHLGNEQHEQLVALLQQILRDSTVIWVSHKTIDETWFNRFWHIQDHQLEERQ